MFSWWDCWFSLKKNRYESLFVCLWNCMLFFCRAETNVSYWYSWKMRTEDKSIAEIEENTNKPCSPTCNMCSRHLQSLYHPMSHGICLFTSLSVLFSCVNCTYPDANTMVTSHSIAAHLVFGFVLCALFCLCFKGSIFLKSTHFFIQELFTELIYDIKMIVKCGILQLVKFQLVVFFITKTCLFKYTENLHQKNENFQIKNSDIFRISAQNIDCGCLLEPPCRGGSNEYPQFMFWAEIRKIMYTPVNPSFNI